MAGAIGRGGRGNRAARGGAELPVGMLTDGGELLSSGGIGDRGGRAMVEDADDDSGHQSPRQEWLRDHGAPRRVSAKENRWLEVWCR